MTCPNLPQLTPPSKPNRLIFNYFNALPDPRQPDKVIYPLQEVLPLNLLAMLALEGPSPAGTRDSGEGRAHP